MKTTTQRQKRELERGSNNETAMVRRKTFKDRLFPHQVHGIEWLKATEKSYRGGILADEMGMGKTVQTIGLVLNDSETAGTTLVICPTSVVRNWDREFRDFSDIEPFVFDSFRDIVSTHKRTPNFLRRRVIIISHRIVRDAQKNQDAGALLLQYNWYRVIVDEAHLMRNTSTQLFRVIAGLKSTYRWCLTATPFVNRQSDVVSLFTFVSAGNTELTSMMRQNRQDFIKSMLQKMCLSRKKNTPCPDGTKFVDIPDPLFMQHHVDLSDSESKEYEEVSKVYWPRIRQLLDHIPSTTGTDADEKRAEQMVQQAMGMWNELRICALHPWLLWKKHWSVLGWPTDDLKVCWQLHGQLRKLGKNCLAFYQEFRMRLKDRLSKAKSAHMSDLKDVGDVTLLLNVLAKETVLRGYSSDQIIDILAPYIRRKRSSMKNQVECFLLKKCLEYDTLVQNYGRTGEWKHAIVCSDSEELVRGELVHVARAKNGFVYMKHTGKVGLVSLTDIFVSDEKASQYCSSKLIAAVEYAKQAQASGFKLLLFSQFNIFLDLVADHLNLSERHVKFLRFSGSLSGQERDNVVQRFTLEPYHVLLISLTAGGVGINLQAASKVVFAEPYWNHAVEAQAYGRAWRIGQTGALEVVNLIARDTEDGKILEMQRRKTNVGDSLLQSASTDTEEFFKNRAKNCFFEGVNDWSLDVDGDTHIANCKDVSCDCKHTNPPAPPGRGFESTWNHCDAPGCQLPACTRLREIVKKRDSAIKTLPDSHLRRGLIMAKEHNETLRLEQRLK